MSDLPFSVARGRHYTPEEIALYNPAGRPQSWRRLDDLDAALSADYAHLASVLFAIERHGLPFVEGDPPPLNKDMALNLSDPANRRALMDALRAIDPEPIPQEVIDGVAGVRAVCRSRLRADEAAVVENHLDLIEARFPTITQAQEPVEA